MNKNFWDDVVANETDKTDWKFRIKFSLSVFMILITFLGVLPYFMLVWLRG